MTDTTGTNAECHSYTAYVLGGTDSVALTLKGKTANVHFRAKADGEYTELKSGETTPAYSFGKDGTVTVSIDVVSDGDYLTDKFDDADKITSYKICLLYTSRCGKDTASGRCITDFDFCRSHKNSFLSEIRDCWHLS